MIKSQIANSSTVLLVDDEPLLLETIEDALKPYFMSIIKASNGREALEQLRKYAVDIVVTDHQMPVMTGASLIKEMRVKFPLTPVIMMTGYGCSEEIMLALKEGAFDVLDKPFRMDVLLNRIQNSLLFPYLVQILWGLLSQKMDTPKVEEFLRLPFENQMGVLHKFADVLKIKNSIKNTQERESA